MALVLRAEEPQDLSVLTLEQLLKVEITSVNKREQQLDRAAAAVYVITQNDIRRSGFTSIPEVLRLAPGLHVARISGESWAITARGFNGVFSTKLLVMVDGRSVYSPIFSGAWWDVMDVMLDDIDRIEVIRGPAGAIWGANAVNGVINIITRRAEQTQGGLWALTVGDEDRALGRFRYGGQLRAKGSYRIFGQYNHRLQRSPVPQFEDTYWGMASTGFRADWQRGTNQEITVISGLYYAPGWRFENNSYPGYVPAAVDRDSNRSHGGHVLARWNLTHASGAQTSIQTYADHSYKLIFDTGTRVTTGDVEAQHRRVLRARHELTLGAGYRGIHDGAPGDSTRMDPPSATYGIGHLSLVDDLSIVPERLIATLGARLEHNGLSGWNWQPTARLWWSPWQRQAVWLAFSHAVRTPSRADLNVRRIWPALSFGLRGDPQIPAETLRAWEVGYRKQWRRFVLDTTAFHDRYRHLRTIEPEGLQFENGVPTYWSRVGALGAAPTWGGEVSVTCELHEDWRVTGSYTGFWSKPKIDRASYDLRSLAGARQTPRHQWQVHSMHQLSRSMSFDVAAYQYGYSEVRSYPGQDRRFVLPARTRIDIRWSRRLGEVGEWSVGARNLLGNRSWEFPVEPASAPTGMRRSVYTGLTWRF